MDKIAKAQERAEALDKARDDDAEREQKEREQRDARQPLPTQKDDMIKTGSVSSDAIIGYILGVFYGGLAFAALALVQNNQQQLALAQQAAAVREAEAVTARVAAARRSWF